MAYMSSRYYSATFLGFLFMVSTLLLQIQPLEATSKSPYDSGYDHSCEDADISDPNNRYINQPKRGPSFHTHEFMRGYNAIHILSLYLLPTNPRTLLTSS